jgi:peptidoglycan hydrolase-like protein with peptidoglycan-binding domain
MGQQVTGRAVGWLRGRRAAAVAVGGVSACLVVAGCSGQGGSPHAAAAVQAGVSHSPPVPLRVLAIAPAGGAAADPVSPTGAINVSFNTAVSTASVHPQLSPPVAGSWAQVSAGTLRFTPSTALPIDARVTVTVPGGRLGMLAADGTQLPAQVRRTLQVADGSTLRLQQVLAQLGYLPLSFHPDAPLAPGAAAQAQAALHPPAGSFSWRWPVPATLSSLWAAGTANTVTQGAVMAFETEHGLAADGVAGPEVWAALLSAAALGQRDPAPYSYVLVTKTLPEQATVYENGHAVYATPANTGIPASPTPDGTWPVYERFTSTTMSGTNPDGSHYNDTGVPWVSYFHGGDALHGFLRSSYGFAQSLGCVEMPYANASVVWHDVNYGTLVSVTG